ncbi:MAG: GNAT family N-acetyltransferase [Syntrophobacteraceae bacterium]
MFGEKEIALKDGSRTTLKLMTREDEEALYRFFRTLPDELLIFIRHNVKDRRVIQDWVERLNYARVLPLLAVTGGEIVGDATLHRVPHGWKRHIGRVRAVVSPEHQNQGLATAMLNELVRLAAEVGLEKLWAEIPLDSVGAIRACRNAGFACKSVIEDLVKNSRGENMDVLIMVCDVARYFDREWSSRWSRSQD